MKPKITGKITAGRNVNIADEMTVVNIERTTATRTAEGKDVNIATRRVEVTAARRRTPAEILADLLGSDPE